MKNLVAALALALSIAGPANASLIGQTANCAITPTPLWTCNTASATVVDPGTEFQLNLNGNPFFSVDLTGSTLLLTEIAGSLGLGAGELLVISGLTGISNASFNSSVGETGFDASDVSFTSSSLTFNLFGSSWLIGGHALIDIATAAAAVPEPGSFALLLASLGFLGFVSSRRRRKSRTE